MKTPDWSLLPHRPRLFFELAEGAGRPELKRAYARLVKQFKPEVHPEEFMRIRAAYEEFERALAYGLEDSSRDSGVTGSAPPAAVSSPAPAEARPIPSDAPPAPTPPGFPRPFTLRRPGAGSTTPPTPPPAAASSAAPGFAEQLLALAHAGRATSPDSLVPKSAEDFIHLAFFREAMAGEAGAEERFFQTLLEGVKSFPRDRALIETLRKFFTSLEDPDLIQRLLEQVRWWLPPGGFFYVTESAWFRLGERAGGRAASGLLRDFMREESANPAHTVFLLRFLRRHFDTVDLDWFGECVERLEEHQQEEGGGPSDELAFLAAVLEFLRLPDGLRERYPVLHEIRAILRLVCRGEAEANLNRIYGFYRKLADLGTTCELFSGPVADLLPAYRLLIEIRNEQLTAFFQDDLARREAGLQPQNLAVLTGQVRRSVSADTMEPDGDWRQTLGGFMLLLAIAAGFFGVNRGLGDWSWWLRVPLAVVVTVIAWIFVATLHGRAFPDGVKGPALDKAWDTYELRVRPHLVEYLKSTRLTSGELARGLGESSEETRADYQKVDPYGFIGKDMPLAFHSLGLLIMAH